MNKLAEERELMKLRLSNKALKESLNWYTDFRRMFVRFIALIVSVSIYLYFFIGQDILDSIIGGLVSSLIFFTLMAIIDRAAKRFLGGE